MAELPEICWNTEACKRAEFSDIGDLGRGEFLFIPVAWENPAADLICIAVERILEKDANEGLGFKIHTQLRADPLSSNYQDVLSSLYEAVCGSPVSVEVDVWHIECQARQVKMRPKDTSMPLDKQIDDVRSVIDAIGSFFVTDKWDAEQYGMWTCEDSNLSQATSGQAMRSWCSYGIAAKRSDLP